MLWYNIDCDFKKEESKWSGKLATLKFLTK